jgi:alanine racemase
VGSDDSKHDTFTHAQASLFAATASHIESVVGYQPLRHLLNSGGIYRFPAYHFDMVRLGIGLYGIGGDEEKAVLKNVNTLKATVSQVKWVRRGDSVGYGRRGIAPSDGRLAMQMDTSDVPAMGIIRYG